MRTTIKDVRIAFKRYCDVFGFEITDWNKPKIGTYYLNTDYRYKIVKIESEGLSISCPFGDRVYKADEFVNALWFAIYSIAEFKRQNKKGE
ncbi:MAG: hypothetical protein PHP92_05725 [Candidatus Nanoarchaeia archaeon]|nr:hypothetical protein [Candidatus Nanoarchaeia archaeon]